MEILTKPWFTINRGWETAIADDKWIINTENKEIIEVLNYLFPILETKKVENEIKKQWGKKV